MTVTLNRAPRDADDYTEQILSLTEAPTMADALHVIEAWRRAVETPREQAIVAVSQDGRITVAPGAKVGQVLSAIEAVRSQVLGLSIDGK